MGYSDPDRQREYQRAWIKARRERWLDENGPCAICGGSDDLEVDHVDPTTKLEHKVWSWAKDRREAELAKCQVLCCACHQVKHDNVRKHGRGAYRKGCRCDICRAACAAHARGLRSRKRGGAVGSSPGS